MANQTAANPLVYDTTSGASWEGIKYVKLFQWVDLNEDIANSDMCSFVVNGVTLEVEVQVEVTANYGIVGPVIWQIGPFNDGIPWQDFSLNTLDGGAVHIWVE